MAGEMFRGSAEQAGQWNDGKSGGGKHHERVGLQQFNRHGDRNKDQEQIEPGCPYMSHERTVTWHDCFVDESDISEPVPCRGTVLSLSSLSRTHAAPAPGSLYAGAFPRLHGAPTQPLFRDDRLSRSHGRHLSGPRRRGTPCSGLFGERPARDPYSGRGRSRPGRSGVARPLSYRTGTRPSLSNRLVRKIVGGSRSLSTDGRDVEKPPMERGCGSQDLQYDCWDEGERGV